MNCMTISDFNIRIVTSYIDSWVTGNWFLVTRRLFEERLMGALARLCREPFKSQCLGRAPNFDNKFWILGTHFLTEFR